MEAEKPEKPEEEQCVGGIFEQEVLASVEVVTVFGDAGSQPFFFFVMLP